MLKTSLVKWVNVFGCVSGEAEAKLKVMAEGEDDKEVEDEKCSPNFVFQKQKFTHNSLHFNRDFQ